MHISPTSAPQTKIFSVLDALVKHDTRPSGLFGKVCLAVRGQGGYRCWSASLGAEVKTELSEGPPKSFDVALYMTEAEADTLLKDGPPPAQADPALLTISGDRSLLKRFIQRYASDASWLEGVAGRV